MSTASVFETLAAEISALRGSPLVAIDGVDGSGKTTFAKSLTAQLNARKAIVIHVDDFLNPPEIRHRRGRQSPEGFWLDSYDYDALERHVLDPLGPGGSRRYRQRRDSDAYLHAADGAIVLVEGLFLHRDELAERWDYSIFLDVPFDEIDMQDRGTFFPAHVVLSGSRRCLELKSAKTDWSTVQGGPHACTMNHRRSIGGKPAPNHIRRRCR
ncbi:hypothetical protein [Rhodococcus erythropolis]|uniref:hypothetical protein n=1 Tax=Rhodococcus erythropolis TaxID=1833 RepID=UPI00038E4A5B|nr:hypothetical protein [Rhodococcus erythropolis]EQM30457.1 hypothetical protein N601_27620 [Rhodococcus erythropolis DN1]